MPTTAFYIATSGDDARINADDQVAYPGSANSAVSNQDLASALKTLFGGLFYTSVVVFRWDTSSIPDAATITGATFRARGTSENDVDSRSITLEWYTWTPPAALADWTATASGSANAGRTIASLTSLEDQDFTLLDPNTNINKSGFTGIRMHVSGGAPSGDGNFWQVATFDNASFMPARLIVDWTLGDNAATTAWWRA